MRASLRRRHRGHVLHHGRAHRQATPKTCRPGAKPPPLQRQAHVGKNVAFAEEISMFLKFIASVERRRRIKRRNVVKTSLTTF